MAGGGSNGSAGIATLNVEAAVEAWLVVVVAALSCQSSRKRCRRRRCSPSLLRVQLLNSWCAKRVWRRACMLVVARRRLVVGRHSAEGASPPSLHRGRSFAWRFNVASSSSSFRLHLREICKSLGTQRGGLLDIRSVSSLLRSRPSSLVDLTEILTPSRRHCHLHLVATILTAILIPSPPRNRRQKPLPWSLFLGPHRLSLPPGWSASSSP